MATATSLTALEGVKVPRFAGGSITHGRVRVGAIAAPGAPTVVASKASIPSRFETVLNVGVRERNAFGRRTHRFEEPSNEQPGPGSYRISRSILSKSAVSYSSKGGACFQQRVGFKDTPPPSAAPGPGAYMQDLHSAASAGSSRPTAVFAPPCGKPLLKVVTKPPPPPGPGDYAVPDTISQAPCAAMVEHTIRDTHVLLPKTAPGPGEFLPASYINTFQPPRNPQQPSHFYASKSGRSGSPTQSAPLAAAPHATSQAQQHVAAVVALPPPLRDNVNPEKARDLLPALRDVALERAQTELITQHQDALSPLREKGPKKSAVFAESILDRFGVPTVQYVPRDEGRIGPGSYEIERKPKRLLISSSWALSGVARDGGAPSQEYKVPGPAYYKPLAPPKSVSHHMMSPDYWA